MTEAIVVALITGGLSLAGVVEAQIKVINHRLTDLEREN